MCFKCTSRTMGLRRSESKIVFRCWWFCCVWSVRVDESVGTSVSLYCCILNKNLIFSNRKVSPWKQQLCACPRLHLSLDWHQASFPSLEYSPRDPHRLLRAQLRYRRTTNWRPPSCRLNPPRWSTKPYRERLACLLQPCNEIPAVSWTHIGACSYLLLFCC